MGTGKSAAGKRAAASLKTCFYDTDKLIEKDLNMSVSGVFQTYGEEFFRKKEREVLEETAKLPPCIISTGGGTPAYSDNLKFMKSKGKVITLLASPETILRRVTSSSHTERPLLKNPNPMEQIMFLLQKRAYYYINGDYLIDTDDRSVEDVVGEIIKSLAKN